MKSKTVYEATDGTRFDSVEQCQEHERLIVAVAEAMLPLGPEREIKSEQFVQHVALNCLQAKQNMLAIVRKKFAWFFKDKMANVADDEIHPSSIVDRVISDGDCRVIDHAWGRLSRINWENFREYEHPYFALNPEKAEVRL